MPEFSPPEPEDSEAANSEAWLAEAYDTLKRMADAQLRAERVGHTLQPTALVHEAWLEIGKQRKDSWQDRAQFLSLAGTCMRRILLHHAERRAAAKRGGNWKRVTLFDEGGVAGESTIDDRATEFVALGAALERLEQRDQTAARIVDLRFFGGAGAEDAARILDLPLRTVERRWRASRAWLKMEIERTLGASPS